MASPAAPKKVGVGARSNVADIFREERAEIFMDNDPKAGYEDDLETRIIYRRLEGHVEELRIDEAWTKRRFKIFYWVCLSTLAGLFLVTLSNMRVQLTVFESQPKLWWLEVIGYVLMSPGLFGIIYFCCPTRKQSELRTTIMAKRRIRHKLYPENFKEIETFNDLDDKYAQREAQTKHKKDIEAKEKAAKNAKVKESKGKGKKGRAGNYAV